MARTTALEQAAGTLRWPRRRWPWALAAVVAGAAAGTAAAYAVRRVVGQDRPDAVEPEQLLAVVDRPDDEAAPAT